MLTAETIWVSISLHNVRSLHRLHVAVRSVRLERLSASQKTTARGKMVWLPRRRENEDMVHAAPTPRPDPAPQMETRTSFS